AQLNEQYFSADNPKLGGEILDFIRTDSLLFLEGRSYNFETPTASYMAAVDKNGEVIWNSNFLPYADPYVQLGKMCQGGDGDIYCIAVKGASRQIWKLDANTGGLIWSAPLPDNSETYYLVRQGNDRIALLVENNGFQIQSRSVLTGDLQIGFGIPGNSANLAADPAGNLYVTQADSLLQFVNNTSGQIGWKQQVSLPFGSFPFSLENHYWFSNDGQRALLFGTENGNYGGYALLDLATGATIHSEKTASEEHLRDFVVRGDTLYGAWQNAFSGGGTYQFSVVAIRLSDGLLAYEKAYDIHLPGQPGLPVPGGSGPFGITMDNNRDLYLTGYCHGDGVGTCAALKVKSADGTALWDALLDITPPALDNFSVGRIAWCPDGEKVFIGGTINSGNFSPPLLFRIDPQNGAILQQTSFYGKYQFPSKTVQILSDNNGCFVLKQLDNCVSLSFHDTQGALIWNREFCDLFFLQTGGLYHGRQQDLYLSANSKIFVAGYQGLANNGVKLFRLN
ncbi:MAG: hypothetical protein ABIO24_14290, partial [Saprospiraceae bacterium]